MAPSDRTQWAKVWVVQVPGDAQGSGPASGCIDWLLLLLDLLLLLQLSLLLSGMLSAISWGKARSSKPM